MTRDPERRPAPDPGRREAAAIGRLRARFRPDQVRVLLVGESAPAGGTHYYRANSNLFSAVHEACRRVYGKATPRDAAFLVFGQETGLWLVDLAAKPVNKLAEAERDVLVAAGLSRVARDIRECDPQFVVSVKSTIASTVATSLKRSGSPAEFVALPFPVRQWRQPFIEGLATVLRKSRRAPLRADRTRA